MPVNDPIADLLTRIRNAQHSRQTSCACPWSVHKQEVCELLQKKEFISDVQIEGEGKDKHIIISFNMDIPALNLKRMSKPGRRVYVGKGDVKPVLQGFGIAIVTTSQGLMTDTEAREKKIGGELLCTIS